MCSDPAPSGSQSYPQCVPVYPAVPVHPSLSQSSRSRPGSRRRFPDPAPPAPGAAAGRPPKMLPGVGGFVLGFVCLGWEKVRGGSPGLMSPLRSACDSPMYPHAGVAPFSLPQSS